MHASTAAMHAPRSTGALHRIRGNNFVIAGF
jgi:hypothetical protein